MKMKVKDRALIIAFIVFLSAAGNAAGGFSQDKVSIMERPFLESAQDLPYDPMWEGLWSGNMAGEDYEPKHITLSIKKGPSGLSVAESDIFPQKNLPWKWIVRGDTLLGEVVLPLRRQGESCPSGRQRWVIVRLFLRIQGDRLVGWYAEKEVCLPRQWTRKEVSRVYAEDQTALEFDRMP